MEHSLHTINLIQIRFRDKANMRDPRALHRVHVAKDVEYVGLLLLSIQSTNRPAAEAGDSSCTLPPRSGLSLLMWRLQL
jgi:hypothetical protein